MNLAVFDVDGTLLDNLVSEDECFERALREGLGVSALSADWESHEHVSDLGIAVEAYREDGPARAAIVRVAIARADRLRAMGATSVIPDFSAVLDVVMKLEESQVPFLPCSNDR